MFNHAPENYNCVLCLPAQGIESEETMMKQADIFYKDDLVIAAVNSKFVESNSGHIIIFPVQHYENIYDMPDNVSARVAKVARHIAIAMKEIRKCDGLTTQQNNEPAGGQHAFHYHYHIFPRWTGDKLYSGSPARVSDPAERIPYATDLKNYFESHPLSF
jgi:histidine triad (HIT) family protein